MNSQGEGAAARRDEMPSATAVAAFLRANPEFLIANPDLLRELELDHGAGDAISLVERQVAVLREENAKLKARFRELVQYAEANDALIRRVHDLAIALMQATGPDAIFSTLNARLAQDFGADSAALVLFADPAFVEQQPWARFRGNACEERGLFAETLAGRVPSCKRLTPAQSRFLFEREGGSESTVVLPLSGKAWDGVLAIASGDPERFRETMGTEFLAYLGDIAALVIDPWVRRSRTG